MKLDALLHGDDLAQVPRLAAEAEEVGIDGLWTNETAHDPFLPLAVAATATRKVELGTAVTVAFARSPAALAYTAWDLARTSRGRFILGLGTQVRAHVVRRFGALWDRPVPQLREWIKAIRSFWQCWQERQPLQFRGRYFKLDLMTPFFDPGPILWPHIPIAVAGVNRGLCRLAGELGELFVVHPLHTVRYLREVVVPALREGAERSGRRDGVRLFVSAFVVTGRDERELMRAADEVRRQIAFYASTPSYRSVLELHGRGEVSTALHRMAAEGQWDAMAQLIDDELLAEVAIVGEPDALPEAFVKRYRGLAYRVAPYVAFSSTESVIPWGPLVAAAHSAEG